MAKGLFIEKSITIDKPKSEVFNYLKYSKNQDKFSVWNLADPDKKTSYSGTDGEVGFIYTWDSTNKNVGAGSQEIKSISPNERIEYELRFERPMKNVGVSVFLLKDAATGTTVTWNFSGPTKFPMSLFKGMFQKMLGKDIAKSLENLKSLLEVQ